jgi:hypothetical protein
MPYITQEDREQYDGSLDDLGFCLDEYGYVAGHVTYVLYMIVARWFKLEPSYNTICKIRGCLIGTLAEFDRRIAAPYEDTKIRENGDVNLEYKCVECDCAILPCCSWAERCTICRPTEPSTLHSNIDTSGGA